LPINTNFPIANPIPVRGEQGQGPAGVVGNFYSFAFMIAGFLAFVMIVYGGVRYTFSAGNVSAKDEAKDAIKQALLGLGLLLVAYLILQTINPDLTQLRMPTLAPYVPPLSSSTQPAGVNGASCQQIILVAVAPDAIPFENGATVSWGDSSVSDNTRRNLTYLHSQVDRAVAAGVNITVLSAWRPYSYQMHLYNVFSAYKAFENNPNLKTECQDLWDSVKHEKDDIHHILGAVARPSTRAPHVCGIAVDIRLPNDMSISRANSILQSAGVDLRGGDVPGDGVHFQVQNPPAGCS